MVSWIKRTRNAVALALFLVLLIPGSAAAVPGCSEDLAPTPESPSTGMTGIFGTPPGWELRSTGTSDLLERDFYHELGASGLTWHTIRESCVDGIATAPIAILADATWMAAKAVSLLAIMLYEWAMRGSLLGFLEAFVTDAVTAMRAGIYAPLLGAVVILGAVWMGWVGLVRKRATLSVEGACWMLAATVCGIWIMGSPSSAMDAASRVTMAGADLAHAAVGRADAGGPAIRCPATWEPSSRADTSSAREAAVRRQSETLWAGLLCTPWMAGELGVAAETREFRETVGPYLLSVQSISRSWEIGMARGDYSVESTYETKQEDYIAISEDIREHDQSLYELFAGDRPADRLGVALMALAGAVCAGGLIIMVSISTLAAQLAFMLLLLLAPVFFLIGTHPGFGRRVLTRWAEVAGGILLRQMVWSLLLMLLVQIYATVLSADLAWGRQMLVLALLTAAVVIYRKSLTRMVGTVGISPDPRQIVARVVTEVGGPGRDGHDGAHGTPGRLAPVRQRTPVPRPRPPRPGPKTTSQRGWTGTAVRAVATRWPQTAAAIYVVDRIRGAAAPAPQTPQSGRRDPGGSGRRGSSAAAPHLRRDGAKQEPADPPPQRRPQVQPARQPRGFPPGGRSPRGDGGRK